MIIISICIIRNIIKNDSNTSYDCEKSPSNCMAVLNSSVTFSCMTNVMLQHAWQDRCLIACVFVWLFVFFLRFFFMIFFFSFEVFISKEVNCISNGFIHFRLFKITKNSSIPYTNFSYIALKLLFA